MLVGDMEVPNEDHRSRRLVLTLPPTIRERLVELAERELRDPRDQAVILIMDGLEAAGINDRTPIPRNGADKTSAPTP